MDLADLTARRLHKAAARVGQELQALSLDGDPEALHRARTWTRRLRVSLKEGAACLPELDVLPLERFWRASDPVRDLDVNMARLVALGPVVAPAMLACRRAREQAWPALAQTLGAELDATLHALATVKTIDAGKVGPARKAARRRHADRLERLDAGADAADPDLHTLRVAVKKARYACWFYADPREKALKRCQDRLGAVQDAVVLERWLEDIQVPEEVRRAIEQDAHDALGRAKRRWASHRDKHGAPFSVLS